MDDKQKIMDTTLTLFGVHLEPPLTAAAPAQRERHKPQWDTVERETHAHCQPTTTLNDVKENVRKLLIG